MKLLFDQNLSWRITREIQDVFPGSAHVREVGLDRSTDEEIWAYALVEGFTIVRRTTIILPH
jgi:predicted nuclease of predicted toxin-antitoxin system